MTGSTFTFGAGGRDVWLIRLAPEGFSVEDVTVLPTYVAPGVDSVIVTAAVTGPAGLSLFAEVESPDGEPLDIIELFDDGEHNDGEAGDSLFGNAWLVPPVEERLHFVDV